MAQSTQETIREAVRGIYGKAEPKRLSLQEEVKGLYGKRPLTFKDAWRLDEQGTKSFADYVGYVNTAKDAVFYSEMLSASGAITKGTATPKQNEMVENFYRYTKREKTWGHKVGSIMSEMIPFFQEIFGGLSLVKGVAKKVAAEALKEAIERAVEKKGIAGVMSQLGMAAAKGTGITAVNEALTTPLGGGMIQAGAHRQLLRDNFKLSEDEAGSLQVVLNATQKDFADALPEAIVRALLENSTEMMGLTLGKLPGIDRLRILQDKLFGLLRGTPKAKMTEILKKGGYDGPIQEMLEELANAVGSETFAAVSPKQFGGMAGALDAYLKDFTAMAVAMSVPGVSVAISEGAISAVKPEKPTPEVAEKIETTTVPPEGALEPEAPRAPEKPADETKADVTPGPSEATKAAEGLREAPEDAATEADETKVDQPSQQATAEWSRFAGQPDAKAVEPRTERQKIMAADAKSRGVPLFIMEGQEIPALYSAEGEILVSESIEDPTEFVIHELVHNLQERLEDPLLRREGDPTWEEVVTRIKRADPGGLEAAGKLWIKLRPKGAPIPQDTTGEQVATRTQQLVNYIEYLRSPRGRAKITRLINNDRGLVLTIIDAIKSLMRKLGVNVKTWQEGRLEALGEEMGTEVLLNEALAAKIIWDSLELVSGRKATAPAQEQKSAEGEVEGQDDVPEVSFAPVQEPDEAPYRREPDEIWGDILDRWLSNRQEAEEEAGARASRHEQAIRALLPKGKRNRSRAIREVDQALHLYIDLKGIAAEEFRIFGPGLTEHQRRVYNRSQNLSPAEMALTEEILQENDGIGHAALKAGVIGHLIEHYSARMWRRDVGDQTRVYIGKFTQTTARSRKRTLSSILHGWSLGKELAWGAAGAIGAQHIASRQVAQAQYDKNFVKALKASGLVAKKQLEPGWKHVNHPNFYSWEWAGKVKGKDEAATYDQGLYTRDGQIFKKTPLFASPKLAQALNNILGSSSLYEIPTIAQLTKWNAVFKAVILTFSLFHHQAFLRSFLYSIPTGDFFKYGPTALGALGKRGAAYVEGRKMIDEFGPEVRRLIRNDLTLGKNQDFGELFGVAAERQRFNLLAGRQGAPSEFKDFIYDAMVRPIHFLFNHLGPNLKVMAAVLEYRHLVAKNKERLDRGEVSHDELAKVTAQNANDDFGGLNLQKLRRNPKLQHLFRLTFLAPDWTESNVRTMLGLFAGGEKGKLYQIVWTRVAMRALLMTAAFNYMIAAGGDPDEFVKIHKAAWKAGKDSGGWRRLRWLEADVTRVARWMGEAGLDVQGGSNKYFSILGHFRDPVKFVLTPLRSLRHKGSVLSQTVQEALEGVDWADRRFTSFAELAGFDDKGFYKRSGVAPSGREYFKGEPKGGKLAGQAVAWKWGASGPITYSEIPSFLYAQMRSLSPIQIQNLWAWMAGELDGFDAITKSAGLMTSRTWPSEADQ